MDPNLESDEIEDSEEDEEDDSDDWTDYSTSISSGSYDDDEYDDFWDSLLTPKFRCTCTKCAILSVIPYLKIKIPDSISKSDVYYLAQYLSKVSETKDVHFATSLKFLPELFRMIKDSMKYGLQEDLSRSFAFLECGHLPETIVLQVVEKLLDHNNEALTKGYEDHIKFEENSDEIKKILNDSYSSLDFVVNEIHDQWSLLNGGWKQWNFSGHYYQLLIENTIHFSDNILKLLELVKVFVPDYSIEAEQCKEFVRDLMRQDETLDPKEELTEFVYVLRRRNLDVVAKMLIAHVDVQDILALCKIHRLST